MYIQKITQQPNFNGKLVYYKDAAERKDFVLTKRIESQFKTIAELLQDKPYDVFISRNKTNPDFYNVAANTSFKKASKVKEYTVKVQSNIIENSIIDAAKDAMEMYEKYILKSAKG